MKLLTLNTHSLQGEDPEKNLEALAAFLLRERPGVAAFQEGELRRRSGGPAPGGRGPLLLDLASGKNGL